jgi:hypothetical protein
MIDTADKETGWRAKAHKIIAAECLASYLQSNTPRRKRHRPYAVPALAAMLVDCLNRNDEHAAKAIYQRIALGLPGLAA